MKQDSEQKRSFEELMAELPNDPAHVVSVEKQSVRKAIASLRDRVGDKVFTKLQLIALIEAAYPELTPVSMSNIAVSLSPAENLIECVLKAKRNIYRFKQPKKKIG